MRFKSFLLVIALLSLTSNLFARDYWGLRNINTRAPDSVYVGFDADFYAFAVSWARTELQDDEFNWQALDNCLNLAERFNGSAVLVASCNNRWATGNETRAPNDINRRVPLNAEPPEHGYSESLYDFAYHLVEHISERENPTARYLRFVNEPQYNWQMSRDNERDVEDYVRCLRTFYIAAHAAAEDNDIEILVSHGGFYLNRNLEREYYRLGEEDEDLQDSFLILLESRYERHSTRIETWDDLRQRVGNERGMLPIYWTDVIAGQTEWLDWFDIHYHWKPGFIFEELGAWEDVVQDSSGELRPWLAAEAAMQLAQGSLTDYEERFHAGDMARKWVLGMAFGLEGICTPMTGYPPEHFFGLYNSDGQEYLSAQTYRFLRHLIDPTDDPEDISREMFLAYRFQEESSIVDVVWVDALFDDVEDEYAYFPQAPEDFYTATVFDILGEVIERFEPDQVDTLSVSQEPVVIVWDMREGVVDEDEAVIPSSIQLVSVYPNPFNSEVTVRYDLTERAVVTMKLYSVTGIEVWSAPDKLQNTGQYRVLVDGDGLGSGVYVLALMSSDISVLQKVVLIR